MTPPSSDRSRRRPTATQLEPGRQAGARRTAFCLVCWGAGGRALRRTRGSRARGGGPARDELGRAYVFMGRAAAACTRRSSCCCSVATLRASPLVVDPLARGTGPALSVLAGGSRSGKRRARSRLPARRSSCSGCCRSPAAAGGRPHAARWASRSPRAPRSRRTRCGSPTPSRTSHSPRSPTTGARRLPARRSSPCQRCATAPRWDRPRPRPPRDPGRRRAEPARLRARALRAHARARVRGRPGREASIVIASLVARGSSARAIRSAARSRRP